MAVAGPLAPLWGLPFEAAAVWDQSRWLSRWGGGAQRWGQRGGWFAAPRGACNWPAYARALGSAAGANLLPPLSPFPPPRRYRTVLRRHNGGVWLLRPCAAVEAHMLRLLREAPKLRFTHRTAEQDFLSWCAAAAQRQCALGAKQQRCTGVAAPRRAAGAACLRHTAASPDTLQTCGLLSALCPCRYHRYTAATLPLQWNCQAAQCLVGGRTVGGAMPRIVHFAGRKPSAGAGISPGGAGHQFLCSAEQLEARARGEPVGPAALPDAALGGLAAAAPGVPASQPALGSLPR